MVWMLLAAGVMAAGQSAMGNIQSQRAAIAENQARSVANRATVLNAAQTVSAINVQEAAARTDAARQLHEAEVAAYAATGSAKANAAAAAVKGASVDAVTDDIQRELGEAQVTTQQNLETQQYNLQNRLREVISGASASISGIVRAQTTDSLVAGLTGAGAAYMNNYMQFGASKAARTGT